MELAEAGNGIANLNLAILLEKQQIFDSNRTLLGHLASEEFNKDNPAFMAQFMKGSKQSSVMSQSDGNIFDINKQIAFKYYQMAVWDKDTEHAATYKIADFLYYGTSGF